MEPIRLGPRLEVDAIQQSRSPEDNVSPPRRFCCSTFRRHGARRHNTSGRGGPGRDRVRRTEKGAVTPHKSVGLQQDQRFTLLRTVPPAEQMLSMTQMLVFDPFGSALIWYCPLSRKLRTVAKVSSMNCTYESLPFLPRAKTANGEVTVFPSVFEV